MESVTPLSSLERPTLSAQVARHLLELVDRDGLRPGMHVPSEVQISRDLALFHVMRQETRQIDVATAPVAMPPPAITAIKRARRNS